jgi:DNA adenine methylase
LTASTSQLGMKIGALAPWFGGKRTLAPVIVEELGEHNSYWEPFCGSMAVLLAKPAAKMETVNDLHGDLINLARVVQGPEAVTLYRRLRRVLFHEDLVAEAREKIDGVVADGGVDRAFWYFVNSWVTRNGTAGTKGFNQNFCRRFTSNGGGPATRLASAVASIPAWRRRLRTVQILNMDGFDMLGRVEDKAGAVIYADPPYLKKGAEYVHDFDWLAHRRLAKLLRRFTKTRVVVSYYDHFDLAELYPGWTKRHTPTTKALVSQGRRGGENKVVAPEVLLLNGPIFTKEGT